MPIFYTNTASIDNLEVSASLLVSGTLALSGSLSSTGGLTGSLLGTSSWSNNAVTASYVTGSVYTSTNPALSASYALTASNAVTASYYQLVTGSTGTNFNITSSASGSIINIPTASATSNGLLTSQSQTIGGFKTFNTSIVVNDTRSDGITGTTNFVITSQTGNGNVTNTRYTGLLGRSTTSVRVGLGGGDQAQGVSDSNYASVLIAGTAPLTNSGTGSLYAQLAVRALTSVSSLPLTASATVYIEGQPTFTNTLTSQNYALWIDSGSTRLDGNLIMSQSNIIVTGSVNATAGFTGSLLGTASYVTGSVFTSANPALSASYALTASHVVGGSTNVSIEDEGSPQGSAGTINFTGAGVTATVAGGVATVDIPGGAGSTFPYTGSAIISGSLIVTGSINTDDGIVARSVTASFTGSLVGSLIGTASYVSGSIFTSTNRALSASYALSASNAATSSYPFTVTGSSIYSPIGSSPQTNLSPTDAIYIGRGAGQGASSSFGSIFMGTSAGLNAAGADNSTFIGGSSGNSANFAQNSVFVGNSSGNSATFAKQSVMLGNGSGDGAINSSGSVIVGQNAGFAATSAADSIFIGRSAGSNSSGSFRSVFIGFSAGSANDSSYSTIIGYRAASKPGTTVNSLVGRNNIIIGTNITLDANRSNAINIGAILFGSGSYFDGSDATNNFSGSVGNGRIGINVVLPNYALDVSGSGNFTSGLLVTGSITGSIISASSFTGSLFGTSSYVTGSIFTADNLALSASFAVSASWAPGGSSAAFPFSGFAVITGSLAISSGSGVFAPSPALTASEALTAGDFINIAVGGVRRASSVDTTKQVHGFVTQSVSANASVAVFYGGLNTSETDLVPGSRYFIGSTGTATALPPTAVGQLYQEIGVAISSTALLVNIGPAIVT